MITRTTGVKATSCRDDEASPGNGAYTPTYIDSLVAGDLYIYVCVCELVEVGGVGGGGVCGVWFV